MLKLETIGLRNNLCCDRYLKFVLIIIFVLLDVLPIYKRRFVEFKNTVKCTRSYKHYTGVNVNFLASCVKFKSFSELLLACLS